jgi:hydrogenase nickel incorporation protein HypA/HybF
MHELSVVLGIINLAEKELKKAGKSKITMIELEIGSLSGVEMSALDYVWETAVKDTVLADAERQIRHIQAKAVCLDCEESFEMNQIYDSCPKCNSHFKNIIQGKELRVKSLEVI